MKIVPFVHEGLGNSSYLVELEKGQALLVDPDRSVQRYLKAAEARGWAITHVFESHLHADFVSGALDIRAATGAELFVPAAATVRFPHRAVEAGDAVPVAGGTITTIASPGHTPEHTSYVLRAEGMPPALFSGGSLLVGGAARTDLISPEMTDRLTRSQFRTITRAFADLPNETLLLPTHGGGSFCSAGSCGERTSTLGQERATNPLLKFGSEEEFAAWFPTTFPAAPAYFFRMRPVNQEGARLRSQIPQPPALEPAEFDQLRPRALVIDARPQAEFMAGHIPGSMSNAFRDAFATWLGWLVPGGRELLFVLGEEPLERVLDECLLVGYERFAGVLAGGMSAWTGAGLATSWAGLTDAAGARRLLLEGAVALDVREPNEFADGHIPGARHIPLGELERRADELPRDRPILTTCGHGERSATALSILERLGFGPLTNLGGGFEGWQAAALKVER
ncbi:MAG: MBL fold metallo-hydrolase [Chloroflexi bacterium]|nr:MBL fold metallo-hydrolase [Chloroflexota bacterium]